MVCLCWLLLVLVAFVCVPGFGSTCWESSICSDLSSKGRALDCIHYCASGIQADFPELGEPGPKVGDDDLLLRSILALLASKDKLSEPDVKAHGNKRRSYTMEHFRWGKPPGDKMALSKLRAQSNKRRSYTMEHFRWGKPLGEKAPKLKVHSNGRRSYSMEHFRWGKPATRKRRPVKVLASLDSSEDGGGGPTLARRQLNEDEATRDLGLEGHQSQQVKRVGVSSETHDPLGLQDSEAGSYRMSHFRWGGPSASKRGDGFLKPWQEKLLLNMFRTIIVKHVQRIIGQRKGRGAGEGPQFE